MPPAVLLPTPVLLMTRNEGTWLVLLPLNRLLASTPLSRNVLDVSRFPFAQIGALPSPEFTPVPPGKFRVDTGGLNGQSGKAAGRQRRQSIFELSST